VLLVPSVREAGARVVAEALLNGVPPLVSNRGGLPEMCRGAGFVLPVDDHRSLDAWIDTLVPLMDDDERYQQESRRARTAASAYDRDVLRPQYDALFRSVLAHAVDAG
jgi:glycosyltransferase involved in cell wall biosynthesis